MIIYKELASPSLMTYVATLTHVTVRRQRPYVERTRDIDQGDTTGGDGGQQICPAEDSKEIANPQSFLKPMKTSSCERSTGTLPI